MVSYFISHTDVREAALREAQVPYERFHITRSNGFLIEEQYKDQALNALNSYVVQDTASEYEGIRILNVRRGNRTQNTDAQPEVSVSVESMGRNINDGELHRMKEIAKKYAPRFNVKRVVFFNNDQDYADPQVPRVDPSVCTIFFWCMHPGGPMRAGLPYANTTLQGQYTPAMLWGVSVSSRRGGFYYWYPSEEQGVIIRDPEGAEVAVVVGKNIYVLPPMLQYTFQNKEQIFEKLLEECVPYIGMTPEERTQFLQEKAEKQRLEAMRLEEIEKAAREERKSQSRINYVTACAGRFNKTLTATQRSITDGRKEIEGLQQSLVKKIREVIGAERKIQQMEAERPNVEQAYAKEFDNLWAIPKVLEVLPEGGVVKVFTDTLYCVDPRTKNNHEIGKFLITINPGGGVQFKNLTRTVEGFYAPHISAQQGPCLGSIAEVIPELVGNYEFATLTLICIQYIESVNVDDRWGAGISRWPVAA